MQWRINYRRVWSKDCHIPGLNNVVIDTLSILHIMDEVPNKNILSTDVQKIHTDTRRKQ